MSAAATAAGYLYASGKIGRNKERKELERRQREAAARLHVEKRRMLAGKPRR